MARVVVVVIVRVLLDRLSQIPVVVEGRGGAVGLRRSAVGLMLRRRDTVLLRRRGSVVAVPSRRDWFPSLMTGERARERLAVAHLATSDRLRFVVEIEVGRYASPNRSELVVVTIRVFFCVVVIFAVPVSSVTVLEVRLMLNRGCGLSSVPSSVYGACTRLSVGWNREIGSRSIAGSLVGGLRLGRRRIGVAKRSDGGRRCFAVKVALMRDGVGGKDGSSTVLGWHCR
jgi:hypothetical protein